MMRALAIASVNSCFSNEMVAVVRTCAFAKSCERQEVRAPANVRTLGFMCLYVCRQAGPLREHFRACIYLCGYTFVGRCAMIMCV